MIRSFRVTLTDDSNPKRPDYVRRTGAVIVGDLAIHPWFAYPDHWQLTHVPSGCLAFLFDCETSHQDIFEATAQFADLIKDMPAVEGDESWWESEAFRKWYPYVQPQLAELIDRFGV